MRFASQMVTAGLVAFAVTAQAEGLSTSAINPTPVPPNGVVSGSYPTGETETSYYLAVDLKAGELATQIAFVGRPGRDKSMELDLKDPKGRLLGYYSIMSGLDANEEASRVFPVDSSGRYLLVAKLKGPETTSFRIELGGSAYANRQPMATADAAFSRSYLAPTALPRDGVIAGTFPGGDKMKTYYYFAADLKAGDLLTQISFAGRPNAPKMLELELLDRNGRIDPNAGYYIMEGLGAKGEKTRAFSIDRSGRHVIRIAVSGAEGTAFRVELGGNAYQVTN